VAARGLHNGFKKTTVPGLANPIKTTGGPPWPPLQYVPWDYFFLRTVKVFMKRVTFASSS